MGKSIVSCRFSLKPIHWYSKNRFTVSAPLPRHTLSAYCPHGLEDWAAAAEHYTAALELVAQNAQKRNPVAASEEMTHLSLSLSIYIYYIYYIIYILYYIYIILYIYYIIYILYYIYIILYIYIIRIRLNMVASCKNTADTMRYNGC